MVSVVTAPYGAWKSSITADLIVGETVGLGQVAFDGGDTYWTELRPSEGGRSVLRCCTATGTVSDLTPSDFNVRSRAHEYGGGAYTVSDGIAYFCNSADQRLMVQEPGQAPCTLTPEGPWRYADMRFDTERDRLIAVREDHDESLVEPANTLVAIDRDGGVTVLAAGADFYAAPRLSPDGKWLAWLTWDHPDMPWDAARLWLAAIGADGTLVASQCIAGGDGEAVFQPEWSSDGILHFVSDPTGWWNLYSWNGEKAAAVCLMSAEFGLPQWVFGMTTYGFDDDNGIIATFSDGGRWRLGRIDRSTAVLSEIETPYCDFGSLKVSGNRLAFIAGHASEPPALVTLNLATGETHTLCRSTETEINPGHVSVAMPVRFSTTGGREAHGFYYAPANSDHTAPAADLPPLIVKSHGGPTGQTGEALNLKIQYWTSRGFAVLDVNYGGSTGYGRAYRDQLHGKWGVVDVDDCVAGATSLFAQGKVDGARLIITGGSAGGYTTLSALTFRNTFRAGASHYGIGDLSTLATDTHKFESRYLDRLVGPWPETETLYQERSPIHFAGQLDCPVIFFQGLDDKVVPSNQAEEMVAALRGKGTPVAYVPFEGEGHGFRQAKNMKRALDGELYFYGQIFGFTPADDIEPVTIENLNGK
jgi:dipeptidyl aminopeptidase/acylaminoacyl peptidase